KGVQNSSEYHVELSTNSYGLRDREYPLNKDSDTFRILILGDSYTFGWGVKIERIFPKLVEQDLNLEYTKPRVGVINCGVYGYGTQHQYKFMRKYGYRLKPDLVIIAMDFLHDIRKNNADYYYFDADKIVRGSTSCFAQRSRAITQYIPFSSFLRGHSHLFRYVGENIQKLYNHANSHKKPNANKEIDKKKYDLDNTINLFRRLHNELAQKGIEFAIVILPEFNTLIKVEPFDKKLLFSFEEFLSNEPIPYLSMQEIFERRSNRAELTFEYSHHFNSSGHRFIAQQILKFLDESEILGIKNEATKR
ncbi:MAG: SGNH/GDSL hydrolase family protein, partial [Bacteroidetes bacterium]|nr:SGNH/GDSL hydrolase family protein [Bacteroidota bacterium]